MAVEPLYNTMAVIHSNLRMTASSDADTLVMIDHAVSAVRLGFFRRLTPARAIAVAALSSEENPTTTDGILRGVAEATEVDWVTRELICTLPVMYIETQFAIKNSFDDVPITRDSKSLQKFLGCLWNRIESGLGLLIIPEEKISGAFSSFSTGRKTPLLLANVFPGL